MFHLEQFILCVGVYPVRFVAFWHMKLLKVIATEEKVMFLHFIAFPCDRLLAVILPPWGFYNVFPLSL